MLTLSKAQADRGLIAVSHVNPLSSDFIDLLNEATRRIMLYGNWWGTVVKASIRTYSGEIGWPRWVGTILALNPGCKPTRTPPANYWGEFLPLEAGDIDPNKSWSSSLSVVHDGVTPVFQQVPLGSVNWLRAYPYQASDIGRSITFYGIDINGNTIRSQINGIWQEGVVIQLAQPYTQMPYQMRKVTRISKDLTDGPLILNQYDPYYGIEFEMSVFPPDETEPSYRHSIIAGLSNTRTNQVTMSPKQVTLLAKQEFIPVRLPSDPVQIDCLGALKLMMMSILEEEASNPAASAALMRRALTELNAQLRDKYPVDTIQVDFQLDGTATQSLQRIGQMQ